MAMRAEVARDSEFEAEIRRGIDRGEFVPFYQPIIQIETGEVASFEALARWQSPKGLISASEFMPFIESRGLAPAIDNVILRGVCAQSTALLALFPHASIAVNVSAAELSSRDLPVNVERVLREFKVPPLRLRLEITETAMMTRGSDVNATLDRLQDMGIAMLLDDFGTGYSSLAYLQRLPIVGLKIDKSFIEHVHEDERALEIVRSIVAIAEAFGLDTTAEGVESERQLDVIKKLGITFAQGFFFSQAVDVGSLGVLRGPGPIQAEHF
jgi:EAL domain-containing protein (putative c-di-GMP-specific phosphodiesterase class I)